jgi:hypothetical protein
MFSLLPIQAQLVTGGSGGGGGGTVTGAGSSSGVAGTLNVADGAGGFLATDCSTSFGNPLLCNNGITASLSPAKGIVRWYPQGDPTNFFAFAAPDSRGSQTIVYLPPLDPTMDGQTLSFTKPVAGISYTSWVPAGGGVGNTPFSCLITATAGPVSCTHGLGTWTPWVACYDNSHNLLGSTGATTSVTSVVATTANTATVTFSGTTNGSCTISTGGVGPTGPLGSQGVTGPTVTFRLGGYEIFSSVPLLTSDLTVYSFFINDSIPKLVTEATCTTDTGTQPITVSVNASTIFTMNCYPHASFSCAATDGSTGCAQSQVMVNTVAAHDQWDLTGTANGTTKYIRLQFWGHQ